MCIKRNFSIKANLMEFSERDHFMKISISIKKIKKINKKTILKNFLFILHIFPK